MFLHHLKLGSSAPSARLAQRHCYVTAGSLDSLLDTPRAIELLLEELGSRDPASSSALDGMARLNRHAIHLSVSRSEYHGLSLEEIVVLCAYTSERFNDTAWKRELLLQPTAEQLSASCRRWLRERAEVIAAGDEHGRPRWPLVGYTPHEHAALAGFIVGLAPFADAASLEQKLADLASQSGFGHEHYVACAPATALDYLRRAASTGAARRWDPFALERRLRSLGLGLLLIERENAVIQLPARYHSTPFEARSLP